MNVEEVRDYCIAKRGVTESLPFDDTTLVFKVMGKMFALINLKADHFINLKCNPELAIRLREEYAAVLPGYHMNKKHWNTVMLNETIRSSEICKWIDNSYDLIVNSLTRKLRQELNELDNGLSEQ